MAAIITSIYDWNKSIANKYGDDWDKDQGGLRCASTSHGGSTFELVDGYEALASNGIVTEVTWIAQVATRSGVSKNKYTFNHVNLYKNGKWVDVEGYTNKSTWEVESDTGTSSSSSRWGIYDGTIGYPGAFSGLSGKTIKVRISIKNSTSQTTLLREGRLTITWEKPDIIYTKPTVTLNSVETNYAPNQSIAVSWRGTNGSNNTISKYEYIYKTTNEIPTQGTTGTPVQTNTNTSIITPNTTAGVATSNYFYVKPYGTNSNYNGSWTGPLTITSYYTDISWSKNFKISGYAGTIYIGTEGSPKGKLTWDTAIAGDNNSISSYKFYKDEKEITSY